MGYSPSRSGSGMAIDSPVNKSFVLTEAKSGIICTVRMTSLGSRNPKAGPCTSESGRNPTLCICRAHQPLCPSGESKPNQRTKRKSIREGGLSPPSVLCRTMTWYICYDSCVPVRECWMAVQLVFMGQDHNVRLVRLARLFDPACVVCRRSEANSLVFV